MPWRLFDILVRVVRVDIRRLEMPQTYRDIRPSRNPLVAWYPKIVGVFRRRCCGGRWQRS